MSNVQMVRDLIDQKIGEADTDNPSERIPALEQLQRAFGKALDAMDGAAFEDSGVAVLNHRDVTEEVLRALAGIRT